MDRIPAPAMGLLAAALFSPLTAALAAGPTHVGGRISSDAVWTRRDQPYIVDSSVLVHGEAPDRPAVLTIEAGVEVRFTAGTELRVGRGPGQPGALVARGKRRRPILFTAVDPKPGKWRGVRLLEGTLGERTILEHCVVEYGGAAHGTNLQIRHSSPVIRSSTLRRSSRHGLRLSDDPATRPQLIGNVIESNPMDGIHADGTQATPELRANVLRHNGHHHVALGVAAVRLMAADNRFEDADGDRTDRASVYVYGGRMRGEHRWPMATSYHIAGAVLLYGNGGEPAASLELAPGTELRFGSSAALKVGSSAEFRGRLLARGTAERPIVFTAATGKPGGWHGLYLADGTVDGETLLEHTVVEFAGRTFEANVYVESSAPVIRHSILRSSLRHGLRLTGHPDSRPQVSDSVIEGNALDGIHADGGLATPTLTGNVVRRNRGRALAVGPQTVAAATTDNTLEDNRKGSIRVLSGPLGQGGHLWPADDYSIAGNVAVYAAGDRPAPSLEIAPGSVLRFAPKARLQIGSPAGAGRLKAVGTANRPIVFTAASGKPGGWQGLYVAGDAAESETVLEHVVVEYAGDTLLGNIHAEGATLRLRDSALRGGAAHGLYARNSQVDLKWAAITDNAQGAVLHEGSGTTAAEYVFWGDASGPAGIGPGVGGAVSGPVDFDPWLAGASAEAFYVHRAAIDGPSGQDGSISSEAIPRTRSRALQGIGPPSGQAVFTDGFETGDTTGWGLPPK